MQTQTQSSTNPSQVSQSTYSLPDILRQRRQKLADRVDFPVVLWSGMSPSRNFPANVYPFRASSHFLYFAGLPLQNAAIRIDGSSLELYMDNPSPGDALWHGHTETRDDIAEQIGADAAFPMSALPSRADGAATLAVQNSQTHLHQSQVLGRSLSPAVDPQGIDAQLADAIIELRLIHDDGAIAELRKAARVSVKAHKAGMAATPTAKTEADVRAAMEHVIIANGMSCAYTSIVSVHGEVLHNETYYHRLQSGDLLLADVGAEAESGWASDITRTWCVSGTFSPTQRAIYEIVLAAHDACIDQVCPGIEYRDLHLLAARVIADGLVDLGILRGNPDDLIDMDAHALFFPHGVGHLIGLDVHDMEDLGDRAGYASGRSRSDRFGLCYLRLDRPIKAGMAVTIEPGFYQVPAILNDPKRRSRYATAVNWEQLADFSDVRGIRIEDDVLVTESGCEVLTADLPTQVTAIEQLVRG
ncbi:MAG: aminopeptidase P family protein [Elainellaceae cyanobacterium]